MGYTFLNVKLKYLVGLTRHKSFGNGQFNPVTDRTTCHMSLIQAYDLAMHFRTSRCRTSSNTLVSKGRHCHWD